MHTRRRACSPRRPTGFQFVLVALLNVQGQDCSAMEITELTSTPFDLSAEETVYIATQRWVLEPWEGEDPPVLGQSWAGKVSLPSMGSGRAPNSPSRTSCGMMAGAAFGSIVTAANCALSGSPSRRPRRSPRPAPVWAVGIFDQLRAANGGTLGGFFDVFAWREPGEMVFTQLAKRAVRPVGGGREHVADLDLVVGDDDAVDEQLGQLPPQIGRAH